MCGLRSKIFRQVVQINQGKADALPRFFGQADGIIFKQAVRLELCGVALNSKKKCTRVRVHFSVCRKMFFIKKNGKVLGYAVGADPCVRPSCVSYLTISAMET